MSSFAAGLFTRVQAASFYARFHREAVATLPPGAGRTWLDVGCGPGLLSRLAAAHGYTVTGTDLDADMVTAARQRPVGAGEVIDYRQADLAQLVASGIKVDVVSASSLLVVLPDAAAGVRQLLTMVKPGGSLVVIEAGPRLGLRSAWQFLRSRRGARSGGAWLLLWALVRGGRTLPSEVITQLPSPVQTLSLLDGMVRAWIITPLPSSPDQ